MQYDRTSIMEQDVAGKPSNVKTVIRGKVQKTCGPLQRYASRTIELLADNYIYVCLDGVSEPYSRVQVVGATINNNSDAPTGFVLLSPAGHKNKFVCDSVESKRLWLGHLHQAVSASPASGAAAKPPAAPAKETLDRSGVPLCEGSLMKRSGMGSYAVRWCELWPKVGLAYAKYKSASDDTFKVVRVANASIGVNMMKLRITISPGDSEPTYLRFDTAEEVERWLHHLQVEAGNITQEDANIVAATDWSGVMLPGDDDVDSDTELELADLESVTPVATHRVTVELLSITRTINANADTPGFDKVLEQRLAKVGDHGFMELLAVFEQRMSVPLYGPHAALHRHISLLDIDANVIRATLAALLDEFPHEVKVVLVAQRADELLRQFVEVREVYVVRREIAEFREQKNQHGLSLGVNATLAFIADLQKRNQPRNAKPDSIAKAKKMVKNLSECLAKFRMDFDFFDDAYFTIDEIERAIVTAETWIAAAQRFQEEQAL